MIIFFILHFIISLKLVKYSKKKYPSEYGKLKRVFNNDSVNTVYLSEIIHNSHPKDKKYNNYINWSRITIIGSLVGLFIMLISSLF
jgi:hypothetical protein